MGEKTALRKMSSGKIISLLLKVAAANGAKQQQEK